MRGPSTEVRLPVVRRLLAADHHQSLVTKQPLAALTHIEPLGLAVLQHGQRKVQVADAAARAITPAGHRAILREEVMQRVNQRANLAARLRARWLMRSRIGSPMQPLNPPRSGDIAHALRLAIVVRPDWSLDTTLARTVGTVTPILPILAVLAILPILPALARTRSIGSAGSIGAMSGVGWNIRMATARRRGKR